MRRLLFLVLSLAAASAWAAPTTYNPIKTDEVNVISAKDSLFHRRARIFLLKSGTYPLGELAFTDGYSTTTLADMLSTGTTVSTATVALLALEAIEATHADWATTAGSADYANASTSSLTADTATTATWSERGFRLLASGTVDGSAALGDVCELTSSGVWYPVGAGSTNLLGVYWLAGSPAWFVVGGDAAANVTTAGTALTGAAVYTSTDTGRLSIASTTGSVPCGYLREAPVDSVATIHFEPDIGAATESGASHTHDASAVVSGVFDAARIPPGFATDAEVAADIAAHTAIVAAHHTRPTWAGDVKPWILAGDGSGSLIDADLLDGYHFTAFATVVHSHDAAAIVSGILDDARFSAWSDLGTEGYLDGDAGDLLKVGDAAGGDLEGTYPSPTISATSNYNETLRPLATRAAESAANAKRLVYLGPLDWQLAKTGTEPATGIVVSVPGTKPLVETEGISLCYVVDAESVTTGSILYLSSTNGAATPIPPSTKPFVQRIGTALGLVDGYCLIDFHPEPAVWESD